MATRSFVLGEQKEQGLKLLMDGVDFPKGVAPARRAVSLWLEDRLLERLNQLGDFQSLKPVLLGSWSRFELSPKSDIDLLFAGPEADVKEFVTKAFQSGLKLRSRTPEDPRDWSVGVEPFDILALNQARALDGETSWLLEQQKSVVRARKRQIAQAIRREREERRKRQDSISNYLEPNLKFGAGGLRDIEQALAMRELFADAFKGEDPYPFTVLADIKEELLFLRIFLHLMGSGDILTAHDQLELAKRLKMDSHRELMTFVQSQLERASFYADWVVAFCSASRKTRQEARTGLDTIQQAVHQLKENPSLLRQFEIRRRVEDLCRPVDVAGKGRLLQRALSGDVSDAFLVALHRTRLFEQFLPDLKKIRGLVQHDHYHRFTADAHLVQTLREVERARASKRSLYAISSLAKELNATDWWILKLTALFHDLAKGRKGDHSTEGAKLVDQYLQAWGYPEGVREDVRWLVENHLILSTAAFRQNPQAQSTWKRLFARGVEGRKLTLLSLFTAVDIKATNPEAWTAWKAQLLMDLVENLRSSEAKSLQLHLDYARKKGLQAAESWILELDPFLCQVLSPRVLLSDLSACAEANEDLPPKVVRVKNRLWIRFHARKDQTGIFLSFVKRLFGFGLNIQVSSVHTLDAIGVYDWFCVRTEKPARQVAKWLALENTSRVQVPEVVFQSIDVMAQEQDEWILSFRGKDQRGLLLAAAQALAEEKLSLRWARAHTWGQQVEDTFSVRPSGEVQDALSRLRARFVT